MNPTERDPVPNLVQPEEPQSESSDRRGSSSWAYWIIALPLIYILSIGPVGALTKKSSPPTMQKVRMVYYPVIWLHDHTPLKKPLEIYANAWGWH